MVGLGLPKVDVDVHSSLRAREVGTQGAMERVGKEMGPEKRRDEWDSGRNRRGRLILGALNIENPRIRKPRGDRMVNLIIGHECFQLKSHVAASKHAKKSRRIFDSVCYIRNITNGRRR